MNDLDSRLLAAHAASDLKELVALYREAADTAPNSDAAGFYLTHAFVFALESGMDDSANLRQRLVNMGRETPL